MTECVFVKQESQVGSDFWQNYTHVKNLTKRDTKLKSIVSLISSGWMLHFRQIG